MEVPDLATSYLVAANRVLLPFVMAAGQWEQEMGDRIDDLSKF